MIIMKRIVKFLAAAAALLMLVSCGGVGESVKNEDGTVGAGDFVCEELPDGTLSVCGYTGNKKSLEVPSELDGRAISAISAFAFENCESLCEITLPDSITSVGACAFAGCTALEKITLPSGATDITKASFEGTPFYDSLGDGAIVINGTLIDYRGDEDKEHITLPNGILKIGDHAMANREMLSHVTIPDGTLEIGERAFASCTSLKNVDMPSSVCRVDICAFENTGLFSGKSGAVVVGDVLIGFNGTKSTCSIPDGVKTIASGAFVGCSPIAVSVPDGVEVLCDYAFWGMDTTVKINLPASVREIGDGAFDGSPSLQVVSADEDNPNFYTDDNGSLLSSDGKCLFKKPEKAEESAESSAAK